MENMAKSYIREIPEGYEARIEGNKVIIELRESEDERTRKELVNFLQSPFVKENLTDEKVVPWLAYLEKQKEQKPIMESKRLALEVIVYLTKCGYSPVLKDDSQKEHFHIDIPRHEDDFWLSEEYKHCCSILGEYYMEGDYGCDTYTLYIWRTKKEQKPWKVGANAYFTPEQKPASTEDMPYITDEHFYEREPKDSFKYKLAEYMTKNCTKKEGPYGYEYGISAETILKMAEEELLKRGVVQKPVKWSQEDEHMRNRCIADLGYLTEYEPQYKERYDAQIDWLKSLSLNLKKKNEDVAKLCLNEWSEEDKEAIDMCLDAIPKAWKTKSGVLLTKWLKEHIQPRNEWSKEEKEKIRQNGRLDVCYNPEKYGLSHKTEWSEEDRKMIDHLIEALPMWANGRIAMLPSQADEYVERLKSLRPQPKVEWTEEEENMMMDILTTLRIECVEGDERYQKLARFLESLRPQPKRDGGDDYNKGYINGRAAALKESWKPSEEQMDVLNKMTLGSFLGSGQYDILRTLYEDLLKLKGGVAPMRDIDE